MTRKDYQLIADALGYSLGFENAVTDNDQNRFWKEMGIQTAILSLTIELQKENPRFDEDKFKEAIQKKAKEIEESLAFLKVNA